jgi:hypothetical protein
VPPVAVIGQVSEERGVHPGDLSLGRDQPERCAHPTDHRHDEEGELDRVDWRQEAEDLDLICLDSHFFVCFTESGAYRPIVVRLGPASGKRDVPGVGGHGVRSLGEDHPDLAILILIEGGEDGRHRPLVAFGRMFE